MQIDDLLITESQLSSRLNKSVQQQRRGEFGLLLAMLSHDALDFSQFHLPKTDLNDTQPTNEQLRKDLGAGPEQPLAPNEFNMLIGQHNAKRLSESGLSDIRLRHCLTPEPLAIRNDKTHVPLEVIDNCELAVRQRHQKQDISRENPAMDAAAFYDGLTNPDLHQPLHLATA